MHTKHTMHIMPAISFNCLSVAKYTALIKARFQNTSKNTNTVSIEDPHYKLTMDRHKETVATNVLKSH